VDPFDWEHRESRPHPQATSEGGRPGLDPPGGEPPDSPRAGAVPSPPRTVDIFAPVPLPEPPPLSLSEVTPPAPPATSGPELPTSWAAQSSKAPSGRSFKRTALALGLVVALTAGTVAYLSFRGGSRGGVALAMSFEQGASWRYRMHMSLDLTATANGQGVPIRAELAAGVLMKVTSVDSPGVATVKLRLSSVVAAINGERTQVPPAAVRGQTLRIAPDGQVVSATLPGVPAAQTFNLVPGSQQVAPLLPDRPVAQGDSWSRDFTVPAPFGAGNAVHASLLATLVRYQPFHGVRAAIIDEHGSIPLDLTLDVEKVLQALGRGEPQLPPGSHPKIRYRGTVSEEDTSWFDPAEGRVLSFLGKASLNATVTFAGLPAGTTSPDFTLSGTVAIDLRPPAAHPGRHPAHHSSGDSVA
jgi:hypothetical protein